MKNTFDLKKFLVENKLTENSRLLKESIDLNLNDLGTEFGQTVKEIFGDSVDVQDLVATYRPSTDTGAKPILYLSFSVPTNQSPKALFVTIGFDSKGNGVIQYNNYSKDKESSEQEFNNKLFPALRKAASLYLGKLVKNPQGLTQATVGSGYKYEEKDQADLDKYVSEIPNLPAKKIQR